MTEAEEDDLVREALHAALCLVWHRFPELVRESTHERTVIAKVAGALQPLVDGLLMPGYRVDVEYNRWHNPSLQTVEAKYLPDSDGERHRVFPDLIVHDGRRDGRGENLLVVEGKRGEVVSREKRREDYTKLRGFLDVFNYRQAAYLEFDGIGGRPRLEWLSDSNRDHDPGLLPSEIVTPEGPIYESETSTLLSQEGPTKWQRVPSRPWKVDRR